MKYKNIHFVGIKGVGMAPLAVIAKEAGCSVTGSDVDATFITDVALSAAGITPMVGFSPDHILDAQLVITTGAHGGMDNIEVQEAKERNIPVLMQGQAVGEFMDGSLFGKSYKGISVSGTHGKTTTTAMIATILSENDRDPGYLIGTSEVPSLGKAGHFGEGDYFVAEADEYATDPVHDKTPKFLWQKPFFLVITNIEFDHPDVYHSMVEMEDAYRKLAENVHNDGYIIACGDVENIRILLRNSRQQSLTYGFHSDNDAVISAVRYEPGVVYFTLTTQTITLTDIALSVPGNHNVLNAVAAILVCIKLKLRVEEIRKGLLSFKGTKRRLEFKGTLSSGAQLYDDYAHHPTEILASLQAVREMYPDKKIICIFQPHTYSRTKELLEQFKTSFEAADTVIITEIYASLREEKDPNFSARLLADGIEKETFFLEKVSDVIKYVSSQHFGDDTVLISMGAGDIYHIDEVLLEK
jgi:UDP-N-acetylmuramate--alanine ligase